MSVKFGDLTMCDLTSPLTGLNNRASVSRNGEHRAQWRLNELCDQRPERHCGKPRCIVCERYGQHVGPAAPAQWRVPVAEQDHWRRNYETFNFVCLGSDFHALFQLAAYVASNGSQAGVKLLNASATISQMSGTDWTLKKTG